MTRYEFIFSDKPGIRIKRHLVFWTVFIIYFYLVNFDPRKTEDILSINVALNAMYMLAYLPIALISAYAATYLLLPLVIRGKYAKFFIGGILLCIINFLLAWGITFLLIKIPGKASELLPTQNLTYQAIIYGLGLGCSIAGFAIIIKLLKTHYQKESENERLKQQKVNMELQAIRGSFHPNFLSASLQNISHLIRNESANSPEVILNLSDLLSYTLYESDKESVELEHEWNMVTKYLELQKIFYGNRIAVNIYKTGDYDCLKIVPLLLLSLVQNCCEQSLISLQQRLNIDIEMKIVDNQLLFKLSCNGFYELINGIAQENKELKETLEKIRLMYPRKHRCESYVENEKVNVLLFLELEVEEQPVRRSTNVYAPA